MSTPETGRRARGAALLRYVVIQVVVNTRKSRSIACVTSVGEDLLDNEPGNADALTCQACCACPPQIAWHSAFHLKGRNYALHSQADNETVKGLLPSR